MSRAVKLATTAIQKLYPRQLADSSWDNTGLLVDSLVEKYSNKVLLTIDLTQSVAEEAIKMDAAIVIAYHPFIFRGLKSITSKDCQQKSLLKLIGAGIAVYSPHTAVDAAVGGVNDWLADGVSKGRTHEEFRKAITASEFSGAAEGAGMGRLIKLNEPVALSELVKRVKNHLGLEHVQLAQSPETEKVSTIAICAGSGSSVLAGVEADVYFTGEMGHHEALHLVESGISAIVCGHSNTERGFLEVIKSQLSKEVPELEISIATTDKDPLVVV